MLQSRQWQGGLAGENAAQVIDLAQVVIEMAIEVDEELADAKLLSQNVFRIGQLQRRSR